MKTVLLFLALISSALSVFGQPEANSNLAEEVAHLKEIIKTLQANEVRSEKEKYLRNYQLVLYAVEIIRELNDGTAEISNARRQNMLYKKIIDINNPSSDVLGFQLADVIMKSLEENINILPLIDSEKKRLKLNLVNLVDGLKQTFPPLQIISSAFSMISSFTTFRTRLERLDRRTDSVVIEATSPVSREIFAKITNQLAPYIEFYTQLNKLNNTYETALHNHVIQYRDYIEEVQTLRTTLATIINTNESVGGQLNELFDLANSSSLNFQFKKINENEKIRTLASHCMSVYGLVEQYKKFTSDFVNVQNDFFKDQLSLLQDKAKKLPLKDEGKIDRLIAELNNIQKGNSAETPGYYDLYMARVKSITTKLATLNKTRF